MNEVTIYEWQNIADEAKRALTNAMQAFELIKSNDLILGKKDLLDDIYGAIENIISGIPWELNGFYFENELEAMLKESGVTKFLEDNE